MSALATIVGSLGELSESELRQLYLMVGVRLGNPDVPSGGQRPPRKAGGKSSNAKGTSGPKGSKKSTSSKGNPARKSQWANHPLYKEYSRLKKVVEAQSKELKCSFNGVDTAESRAYQEAFTQWVNAKHSFRDHGESGQSGSKPVERKAEEEDTSDEEEVAEAATSSGQAKPAPPPPRPQSGGKTTGSSTASGASGKTRTPPGKGKAPAE